MINKIKSNKGISLTDVVVAVMIMLILGATVANMFYRLYTNNSMIRLNALALNYAVNILEDTDKLSYDEVNNDLIDAIYEKYDFPDYFSVKLTVENYNETEGNEDKMDIIKILTLKIKYYMFNTDNKEELTIKKLKIKEL